MIRRPPRSTRTDTLFPYTTLFRNIGKLSLDQPLHLLAGTLSAEVQQAGDLIEAEPYCLCPPDESKTAYIARSIATYASCWALGYMQQAARSEAHTSELQSLMRISYAVFCLKKKTNKHHLTL